LTPFFAAAVPVSESEPSCQRATKTELLGPRHGPQFRTHHDVPSGQSNALVAQFLLNCNRSMHTTTSRWLCISIYLLVEASECFSAFRILHNEDSLGLQFKKGLCSIRSFHFHRSSFLKSKSDARQNKILQEERIFKERIFKDGNINLVLMIFIWLASFTLLFESQEHWGIWQSFFYTVDTGFARLFGLVVPSSFAGKVLTIVNELFVGIIAGFVVARYAENVLDEARRRLPIGRLVKCDDDETISALCAGIPLHSAIAGPNPFACVLMQ
jgi:hypothetical protein